MSYGGAHGGGAASVATVGRSTGRAYKGWVAGAAEVAAPAKSPPTASAPLPAPANIVRGRLRWAWLWSTIWLIYLAEPVRTAWRNDSPALRALGTVTVGLFAVIFIVAFWGMRLLRRRDLQISGALRWGVLAVQVALAAAAIPAIGQQALGMLVYVVITAFFAVPTRAAVLISGGSILLALVVPQLVAGWEPTYQLPFTIFVASVAMWGILQIVQRNFQLAEAHSEIARLAVADERNRFARDLHDILGHTLTVITVKAELAGRLVRLAPERAEAEIAELEGIARGALHDVRDAVAGYREVVLAGELASARTVLSAAGIEAELADRLDQVPADRQELFGWVVREGVTNVVRHSSAKRCRIRITPTEVEITDDGRGPSPAAAPEAWISAGAPERPGHGLAGLRERAEAAGGSLSVGRSAEGGFALRVRVP
jgi:two-component system, NarL family, sensor histidine kinase DesK